MSLNYYSRIRFITNLLPLLQGASTLRRVVNVGGGGGEGPIDTSDFPAVNLSFSAIRGHLISLVTLGLEAIWKTAPTVTFIHNYPGSVPTPLLKSRMSEEQISKMEIMPVEESGDRHVFMATSAKFPEKNGGSGVSLEDCDVAIGTDGEVGSGMYSVGMDCESTFPEVRELLAGLRGKGVVEEVRSHTIAEFERITKPLYT